MVGVICSRICNVIQNFFPTQTITFCDCKETSGAEGTLGIDVETFALATAHAHR
jgi:hypothetical protein